MDNQLNLQCNEPKQEKIRKKETKNKTCVTCNVALKGVFDCAENRD